MITINDLKFKKLKKNFRNIIFIYNDSEIWRWTTLVKHEEKKIKELFKDYHITKIQYKQYDIDIPCTAITFTDCYIIIDK